MPLLNKKIDAITINGALLKPQTRGGGGGGADTEERARNNDHNRLPTDELKIFQ